MIAGRPCGVILVLALAACMPLTPASSPGTRGARLEMRASFPLPQAPDTAWMEVFVPSVVPQVRGVIVFIDRGLDRYAYDDRDWREMCERVGCALLRLGLPRQDTLPPGAQLVRNATVGGGAALLEALRLAAARTGHDELRDANVLLFGFSAAGSFGPTFAGLQPDRTIGVIRYHAHLRGLTLDTVALTGIPVLSIAGARDDVAGTDDAKALWRAMRARGAPWSHVTHIGQPHSSVDGLVGAGPLMRDWAEAVVLRRTAASPNRGKPLVPSDVWAGWIVDDSTGEVAPVRSIPTVAAPYSWMPDERSALELRSLAGMCASVGLSLATEMLGSGARLEAEDASACHYSEGQHRRDLWLSARRAASEKLGRAELARASLAANGRQLTGIGDAGFLANDLRRACSTAGIARSIWIYYVSLCGAGFGVMGDSGSLSRLAARVAGSREHQRRATPSRPM